MRAPLPVEFTSAPGPAWRAGLSILASAAVAVPLAWGLPYAAVHWGSLEPDSLLSLLARPAVQAGLVGGIVAVALMATWLWRTASPASERTLRWDGQDWILLGPDGAELRGWASLMLDFGPWMLASFRRHGESALARRIWLPLSLGGEPARWSALRAAMWSCARNAGRSYR